MLKKVRTNEGIQYKKLSPEEMKERGILGRLIGPCADFNNATRNGRKYSEQLWENVFNDPIMQEKIRNGVCFGELGHPEDRTEIDMEKIAVCLREQPVKNEKGQLCAVFDILDTPNGRILKTLCDYGSTVGVSSRGQGDIITDIHGEEAVDPDTYECECWDVVLVPAVESARMTYVKEGLEDKKVLKLKKALTESLNNATEEDKKVMEETLKELNIHLNEDTEEEVVEIPEENNEPEKAEDEAQVEFATEENSEEAPVEEPIDELPLEEVPTDEPIEEPVEEPTEEDTRTDEEIFFDYLKANFDEKQIKKACKALDIEVPEDEEEDKEDEEAPEEEAEESEESPTEVQDEEEKEPEEEKEEDKEQPVEESLDPDSPEYDEQMEKEEKVTERLSSELGKEIELEGEGDFGELVGVIVDGDYIGEFKEKEIERKSEEDIYNFLKAFIEKKLKECIGESCADKKEEANEAVNEAAAAINDGDAALIKSLQEALKGKSDLEGSVKSLQEKLAVSDTKVNELTEENNNYKKAIARLATMSKSNKDLKESVTKLEESLKEKDATIEEQKTRIARLVKSRKESVTESASLNESVQTKTQEVSTLTESLNKANANVTALNEKLSNSDKEISELNESLDKAKTLKEAYKKLANKAVNKYIDIKATTLGLSSADIKRKLGESYTLEDVDQVCEDLKAYQLNVSKLPFSIDRKVGVRVNEAAPKIVKKNDFFDDDEVDDNLIKLAKSSGVKF